MSATQSSTRPVELPCRLCGAPAGMTCLEYEAIRQLNRAFDKIEASFATPETVDREIELSEFATECEREGSRA